MNETIGILTGGTVIAGLIVWATKLIIAKVVETGGEVFKTKLDKELAVHQKNLDLIKIQYQIQYSSLNEKRGKVIAKLYSLLYDLEQDLLYYTDLFYGPKWKDETERDKQAAATLAKTEELFEKNRIYFDEELCDKIDKIIIDRADVITKMREAKIEAKIIGEVDKKYRKEADPVAIVIDQNEKVRGEIAESRKLLAEEFRALIGVEVKS
jgi:hypothetical protein